MTKRQQFTKEFKIEAVRLLNESDKPASDLARELGIRRNQLYKWQKEINDKGDTAFPSAGRKPTSERNETELLKAENEKLKEEVEILKKAAVYFARQLQ